jgi:hypothetical protein
MSNNSKRNMMDKRGQIGESITWVVATLILIILLLVSIYITIALSKTKSLKLDIKSSSDISGNWINAKTDMAYLVNSNNKNKIDNWISEEKSNG